MFLPFDERQNDENSGFNLLYFYMLFLFTWPLKIQEPWCFICAVLVFCSQKAVFIFIYEAADEGCLTVMTVCLESIWVWYLPNKDAMIANLIFSVEPVDLTNWHSTQCFKSSMLWVQCVYSSPKWKRTCCDKICQNSEKLLECFSPVLTNIFTQMYNDISALIALCYTIHWVWLRSYT